ncbi:MAG TPA: hypothetical protein VFA50_20385 [Stellaceae bacterium]|nr:hypothetical protein [Stellaceae bacterium]
MIRPSTALWLALVALLGFAMFKMKYEVMGIEDELARVNRAIVADQDQIHVLKAEWSFLSQPARLAELSRRFLDLAPVATKQLGTVESVPLRNEANPAALAAAPAPLRTASPPAPNGTKLATARLRTVQ